MPKVQKLKQNSDFRRSYGRGKSFSEPALVTYVLKNNRAGVCRYGITTGKKIGNAVKRNRARRVIRAAYSVLEPRIDGCYDIVFVARTRTTYVKMQEVLSEMERQFIALGVIK